MSTVNHGFTVTQDELVAEDRFVEIRRKTAVFAATGQVATYLFTQMKEPGYVMVCPRLPDGRFVLTRQVRLAAGATVDFIAGGRQKGESWEQAARRELREEVGLQPTTLVMVGQSMNQTDRLDNFCVLFLAFDCMEAERTGADEVQSVERIVWTEAEVRQAIANGESVDMATQLGFYAHLLHKHNLL